MGENNIEKSNSSKEILIELLKRTFSQSLTNLENRNNEEIFILDNSKKFFNEYNITIEKMLKEFDEIENKEEKKEIKDEKKENKKEEKKEIKDEKKENKKEEKKEIKKEDKKIDKKHLNKKEENKEKEKEKKLISKKENEKNEKEKEKEKKLSSHTKKESKKMTRSKTLTNLKEKKVEVNYMNTEPTLNKPKEKKQKTIIRSKTERNLKSNNNNSNIHNKSNIKNSTFPNKKFNTINIHNTKNQKKNNIKKNSSYYFKTYCNENWFENILSYLTLNDKNNLILSSKIFKQYHIERLNKLKKLILIKSNINEGKTIEDKINEYKSKYSEEELNKQYIEFQMSKGTIKAIELLNNEEYTKIFHQKYLENELNEIYIVYRCFCYLINERNIAEIKNNKTFWIKFCEFFNDKSKGKKGDYIKEVSKNFNFDDKNTLLIEELVINMKNKIIPSYYSKICATTGLIIFLIKDALEYNGVLALNKKTQISRLFHNLEYGKNILDKINKYIKFLSKL